MRPALLALFVLVACSPTQDRAEILAIGDSVMAWNGNSGIPEAASRALGRPISDESQSLAHVTHPNGLAAATGFDITRQYDGRARDWVIATGGGNDIRDDCATPRAQATRDGLIGPDLTGDIPNLIARIRATGTRVLWMGYYDGAKASPTGFTPCQPEFDIMHRRLSQLAARDPGIVFFDAGDVINTADR
ncbi:MAG: SGNH/GDSL hydrolase family protein, partial [Pseudomonadota bacterium]